MPNPHLPIETLDNIVDHLHDAKRTLRNCCLVSKSWIPRTRTHLFADIRFVTEENLKSWKETFPDPSSSPAHYTKSLTISCSHVVVAADAKAGGWITGFSNVVCFEIGSTDVLACGPAATFAPFHGFSPRIKSLHANFAFLWAPQFFDLILTFPLLKNLSAIAKFEVPAPNDSERLLTATHSSSLPTFTGSLNLQKAGLNPIARQLLSIPGGIHFRKLTLSCVEKDPLWVTGLIEGCFNTLESLHITCGFHGEARSIDLSKATKLKDAVFKLGSRRVEWITLTLQTISRNHRDLRQVSIHMYWDYGITGAATKFIREMVGEQIFGQWLDLDRVLNQLWESCLTHPKVVCIAPKASQDMEDYIGYLLPEMTKRGAIGLSTYILKE